MITYRRFNLVMKEGMTCQKCQSQNAEPIVIWTISGRKMTIPQLRLWAWLNLECRHQWPREFTSPIVTLASPACPDLLTQEVTYDPCKGSFCVSPSILDGKGPLWFPFLLEK